MNENTGAWTPFDDPYRDWDGAYLLGSLAPEERSEYEEHLASCPRCSAAVAELAGLPGILARIREEDTDEIPVAAPMPDAYRPLAARVRRHRVRRAALAGVIAAGSAAAAAGLTYGVASQAPATPPAAVQPAGTPLAFQPVDAAPLTVTGSARQLDWGTQINWSCYYATPATYNGSVPGAVKPYVLVVTDADGVQTVAAGWNAGPGSTVSPTATVNVPLARIRSIEVRWAATGKTAARAVL
ncbi:MAG TPA: zf-HC2 domain-containing protein [Micrococcaceae bacterium]|jgi:RNA polymerase sigma-70 factor (ECF subfamily)